MDEDLRQTLIETAKVSEVLHYGDLAPDLELDMENPQDRLRIGELLGEISTYEVRAGRPMLSSVVVQKADGLPGHGFFQLGKDLRLVGPNEDAVSFAVRQLKATFEFWSAQDGPVIDRALASWHEFAGRLAVTVEEMPVESFLVLSLPSDPAGSRAYVQFAHWGEGGVSQGVRAEAVGNLFLPDTRQLTPAQEERLEALDWQRPTPDEKGQNFHREWRTPAPAGEIADLVVRTLREVYGVDEPTDLRYQVGSWSGDDPGPPDLGLGPEPPSPRPRSKTSTSPSTGALEPTVEAGLRGWLGVDQLARDADGDYPIAVGSALVYVRLIEEPLPMIVVFSSILTGVDESTALFAALNDINMQIHFARAFWVEHTIVIAMELPVVDVTAEQIAFACIQLSSLADHLDNVIHGRFGGGFAFEGRSGLMN